MAVRTNIPNANSLNAIADKTGALVGVTALNRGANTTYLMFFDKAGATPDAGSAPAYPAVPLETGVYYESDLRREFTKGCWIRFSTTADTLTVDDAPVDVTVLVA